MKYMMLMVALLGLGGCAGHSLADAEDSVMVVSLVYDKVPCGRLTNERNALAREVGVPTGAKVTFTPVSTGFGVVIPDFRSNERRKRDSAVGKIVGMNDSLLRRCSAPVSN
ncbi:MAG TPA: hypothetical protein VGM46_01675 [Mesorhizobium sp.]|jgi:hypothetical protein